MKWRAYAIVILTILTLMLAASTFSRAGASPVPWNTAPCAGVPPVKQWNDPCTAQYPPWQSPNWRPTNGIPGTYGPGGYTPCTINRGCR